MQVYVTRHSVCAADDIDAPHARRFQAPDDCTPQQIVSLVWRSVDLPKIEGGKATWCISSGTPLAVVAEEWAAPKMIRALPNDCRSLDWSNGELRIHVSYFAQLNPDTVFRVLWKLQLKAY